jgi:hypothetical protein
MFFVITNIYKKKNKEPTLMELFTAIGKLKKFFFLLDMFDVCTTGDTLHIDTIFKLLPHTLQPFSPIVPPFAVRISRVVANVEAPGGESGNV